MNEKRLIQELLVGIAKPEGFRVSDFWQERHRHIFKAIRDVDAEGTRVDLLTVGMALRDQDRLDVAGGMDYLTDVANYDNRPRRG